VPLLSRWFLRTAIAWLVAGLAIGILVSLPSLAGTGIAAGFAPVEVHALVVGWATQMIFGVAHWMCPRPGPGRSFGNPVLGWSSWAMLNAGLILRAVAEPLNTLHGGQVLLLTASALLQLAAIVLFTVHIWPRTAPR
jgi:hypothetical protein